MRLPVWDWRHLDSEDHSPTTNQSLFWLVQSTFGRGALILCTFITNHKYPGFFLHNFILSSDGVWTPLGNPNLHWQIFILNTFHNNVSKYFYKTIFIHLFLVYILVEVVTIESFIKGGTTVNILSLHSTLGSNYIQMDSSFKNFVLTFCWDTILWNLNTNKRHNEIFFVYTIQV